MLGHYAGQRGARVPARSTASSLPRQPLALIRPSRAKPSADSNAGGVVLRLCARQRTPPSQRRGHQPRPRAPELWRTREPRPPTADGPSRRRAYAHGRDTSTCPLLHESEKRWADADDRPVARDVAAISVRHAGGRGFGDHQQTGVAGGVGLSHSSFRVTIAHECIGDDTQVRDQAVLAGAPVASKRPAPSNRKRGRRPQFVLPR